MNKHKFELISKFKPQADQIKAIDLLTKGITDNKQTQVLLGATGTGKTFTIANVIANLNMPTLILEPNKTLAAQIYSEMKQLFPNNRVEYFVSNFDYYQPEAYMPKTDTYIEKNAVTNDEIDMLRMSSYNSVLERNDTIVVSSVACIYATSNPSDYSNMFFSIKVNEKIERKDLISKLINLQYVRNDIENVRGSFSIKGDVFEIVPGHSDNFVIRIETFDDTIEKIKEVDPLEKKLIESYNVYIIYPASGYARNKQDILKACKTIEDELEDRLKYFKQNNKLLEYERLEQRCRFDLEALKETGFCSGIENYAMHIDFRKPGDKPYNLFDYFKDKFLIVVDESHIALPQIKGMYEGDRARKQTLVNYGFRLPSALENRPMTFLEFEQIKAQRIYVSATPGDYELELVNNNVVEQIIRPTGLLDPIIEVRQTLDQIDNLLQEIKQNTSLGFRTLITTLTVKMSEKLTEYLKNENIKVAYLHHETKTLERTRIIHDLRKGEYDVLVGINLLREGLDIPEVSLIAILDADAQGFLRSSRSLIQTIGRAARNANGKVIMYADSISIQMKQAIDETQRRRDIQIKYNKDHNITPKTIIKDIHETITSKQEKTLEDKLMTNKKLTLKEKDKLIKTYERQMRQAAKDLNFEKACELRDLIIEIKNQ